MGVGFAQQTEHRLPCRKIVIVAKLEAITAVADRIEDEHRFESESESDVTGGALIVQPCAPGENQKPHARPRSNSTGRCS